MASTFFDSFLPALTGDLGKIPGAMGQGQLQGMEAAQQLALLDMKLKQQQQELAQSQQLFPYQLQLQKQSVPLELQKMQSDLAYKKALAGEAEARGKMYAGGMYPPGSIQEKLKRDIAMYGAESPQGILAAQQLNQMAMAPQGGQGVLITPQQMQNWVQEYVTSGGQIKPPGLEGHDAISRANQALFNQMLQQYGQPPLQTSLTVPGEGTFPGVKPPGQVNVGPRPSLSQNRIDYATKKKAELAFMPGSTEGRAIRSFSTIIHHGNTLLNLVDALNAGDLRQVNRWSNLWSTETGGPEVTNFDAARKVFADEVSKAIIGGATALGDREANANSILALSSPAQLKGAIKTYMELAGGQLDSYKHQYEATTGKKDFDKFLIPEAVQKLRVAPTGPNAQSSILNKSQLKKPQASGGGTALGWYESLPKDTQDQFAKYYRAWKSGQMSDEQFKNDALAVVADTPESRSYLEKLMARKQ